MNRYQRIALYLDVAGRKQVFEIGERGGPREDEPIVLLSERRHSGETDSTKGKAVDMRQSVQAGIAWRLGSRQRPNC